MEENLDNDQLNPEFEDKPDSDEEVFSQTPAGPKKKVEANIAEFDDIDESQKRISGATDKLQMLKDLNLNVYIELGKTQMQIKDILELERGYVIELDKLASEPVDIYVNNKKIAEGEVVVIDKHFGIRITNLNEPNARLKGLI